MLGKRSAQCNLFSSEQQYLSFVGEESLYGYLALHRHELFSDDDFAFLYCLDNGRTSVPPSMIACALLLQCYDRVSDQEAIDRATYDMRWKVALGVGIDERPFAKSTLWLFRHQLIIHRQAKLLFQQGITYIRQQGFFKKHKIHLAIDTSAIFGKGAVEDTYNLLAEGLRQVLRVLARLAAQEEELFASTHDFSRYLAPSYKGTWSINWDDERERQTVVESLVADCHRVLSTASSILDQYPAQTESAQQVLAATELLSKLLAQDIRQRPGDKAEIIDGVAPDRIVSVHDPEMRHGHKSVSNRFDGYKASIAVDTENQLITDVDVLAANVHDNTNASTLVTESAKNIEQSIDLVIGDGAYGTVEARLEAQKQGYTLIAPVGQIASTGRYTKEEFLIDLQNDCVTCPAGQRTKTWYAKPMRTKQGTLFHHRQFSFSVKQCRGCSLRTRCLPPSMQHRTIFVNEHEDLLQQARFYQRTNEYRALYRKRVVVEHRIARLRCLGFRKARYFGSSKILFQLAMAATVANLTLLLNSTTITVFLYLCLTCIVLLFVVGLFKIDSSNFVLV